MKNKIRVKDEKGNVTTHELKTNLAKCGKKKIKADSEVQVERVVREG